MIEPMSLAFSMMAGTVLGTLFFGGLWWTVRRACTSPRPALWFSCSLILRMLVVLAGIYFVGGGDSVRMIACLVGFVVARYLVTRLAPVPDGIGKEADHAP